ncbi:MAG: hypothetical protein ACXVPN_12135 [Bacteroidia bacterium]
MTKAAYILSIILFHPFIIFAQDAAREAEKLFANTRYAAIWPYYAEMLQNDSLNAELNYKMGICYLNSRSQKDKAALYFNKALTYKKENASSLSSADLYRYLAEASYLASNFDQAIDNYQKYRKELIADKKDSNLTERISHKIEICRMAKEISQLKNIIVSLKEKQAGKESSSLDPSSLSLTFKMPPNNNKVVKDGEFFDDFPITLRASNISQPDQFSDTIEVLKEATVATSVDGQIILIYRNDKGVCNLYASHMEGNSWTSPEKLNKIINTKGWEPDEFVSADGNTLYFASNRPGGYGGKDIYKSTKLPNGEWGKAINLGSQINTPYDDEAPFIHPDGVTLYYSIKKNKKNGSYNIYTSNLSGNGTWSEAISVGYPISKTGNIASPASVQKENHEKENYVATFLNPKKTPLTLIKGKILDKNGKLPGYTEITVTDNISGEIAGIYHSDEQTGQFIFILPPNGNSTITYRCEGYLFHQETINTANETNYYKLNKTIMLSPLATGTSEMLTTVSFTGDKASPSSLMELNTLYDFLLKNPAVSIEIFAYENKEKSSSNTNSVESSITAVKKYLTEKGMDKERIETRIYKKPKKKRKKGTAEEENGKIGIKIINIKQNNL